MLSQFWKEMVQYTEDIAIGTDYLRVDYFVRKGENNASFVASEMNTFPWPNSTFYHGFEHLLLSAYSNGLKNEKQKYNF